MRRITVSVLSIFMVLPAFGGTRLPVVNVGAAGVSARDAFGEGVQKNIAPQNNIVATATPVSEPGAAAPAAPQKNVVARATKKTPARKTASADVGEKIVSNIDVLVPNRPSSDLWAQSDTPLRMPTDSEISLVRADYDLPEEMLDSGPRRPVISRGAAKSASVVAHNSALDTEIDRLIDVQRQAEKSRNVVAGSRRVIAAPVADVSDNVAPVVQTARTPIARVAVADAETDAPTVRRMVVAPVSEDVIVRAVEKNTSPRIVSTRNDMTSLSPSELRKAFRKTYLSENKHLSTYQVDDRFDVASDMSSAIEGFTAKSDLSEAGGIRPLEIKIKFRGDDSALSRENYNLLTEYAGVVVNNPKRAIQVAIPQRAATNVTERKLAARRLAIVEQVLRDTGVSEQRIMPVLSQRNDDSFVLRIISGDQYETLNQKKRDMFGDTIEKKTYKSMSW